ncbi:MAG TPA: nuclear transport factor 2 family protein [Longimicrobiales bacterium]|nr:nuclear transport factor 2 family protein [Longimicrobiales bacterium]
MKLALAALILLPQIALAQDAESLRARIEAHYNAIHAGDGDAVWGHHLEEFTLFPQTGHVLREAGFREAATRMGAEQVFPSLNVEMRHFSAQIYDDVGVATFYLDGSVGDERGTWRVTAVWVWRDGAWMEAHHHESRLVS